MSTIQSKIGQNWRADDLMRWNSRIKILTTERETQGCAENFPAKTSQGQSIHVSKIAHNKVIQEIPFRHFPRIAFLSLLAFILQNCAYKNLLSLLLHCNL